MGKLQNTNFRIWKATWAAVLLAATSVVAAQTPTPQPNDLVLRMLENERYAAAHRDRFEYMSTERSERTGNHLWTEHVVETPVGRVRLLLEEDGKPITAERAQGERARLQADANNPADFAKAEAQVKDDEAHARSMLELIPKGFILENLRADGPDWRMDFRPNPDFSPGSTEEKVLHGMSGYITIDQKSVRMHHIEGRLCRRTCRWHSGLRA